MIEVFADVACPFARVGFRRFVARRAELGREAPALGGSGSGWGCGGPSSRTDSTALLPWRMTGPGGYLRRRHHSRRRRCPPCRQPRSWSHDGTWRPVVHAQTWSRRWSAGCVEGSAKTVFRRRPSREVAAAWAGQDRNEAWEERQVEREHDEVVEVHTGVSAPRWNEGRAGTGRCPRNTSADSGWAAMPGVGWVATHRRFRPR